MDIKQALVARQLKQSVVLNIPFLGDIEYERILSIHSHLPKYGIDVPAAVLKDKCGHSITVAALDKIRLKENGSGKPELPKV